MKITVTFDSLEEFQQHFGTTCAPAEPVKVWEPDTAPQKALIEETAALVTEAPDPVETPPAAVTEDFRVEVRKVLAELNKKQAGNPAKKLIAETGYKRLTDVPLELLPGLMEKAKEALDA